MRVAIVTETFPPEINGVAMTIDRLVDGLRERNHDVLLFRPKQFAGDTPKTESAFYEVLTAGIPIPRYQGLKFGVPHFLLLFMELLKHKPDVVHVVTEGPLGWAAVVVAKRLAIPVTSSFHTNFHSYTEHYGIGFLQKLTAGYLRLLHNATAVTFVPTKLLAQELAQDGYQNLSLMSRGVDTELFNPERRSAELRASWGVKPDDLVVIHVGRLAAEKNLALVMTAFSEIRNRDANAKLVLVGAGPLKDKLQQQCPDAIFTGNRLHIDLATHYASGDLFLFPSITETYGNVVSEALASGLCVLAYQHAAAAELIRNHDNGMTVTPHDEAAFIAAAVNLAQDKIVRKAIAARACASIAHLDWKYVYDAFISKLIEVINLHEHEEDGGILSPNASIESDQAL